MARYLISTSETYRVDSEAEAKQLIEEAKSDKHSDLVKYSSVYKNQKAKGEIIQEWHRVTLTRTFTDEKEPDCTTSINYKVDIGAFPEPITKNSDDEEEDNEF